MEVLDRAGVKYLIKKISEKISGSLKKVTYSELKTLRDNSQLTPGQQYRITNYITTTNQENTQSARHQFDIIVTANDNKTLNEKAKAIQHEGNVYFAYSDLNTWEIWYCLDNDGDRFAWGGIASEKIKSISSTEQTFTFDNTISYILFNNKKYVLNIGEEVSINSGPPAYVTLLEDGKSLLVRCASESFITSSKPITIHFSYSGTGVIYRMIDEFGNDCPYDFKNIQFKHPIDAEDTNYYYTFSFYENRKYVDASLLFLSSKTSSSLDSKPMCSNNIINSYIVSSSYKLPNNIIRCNNGEIWAYNNRFEKNCYNNFLGIACDNNSFASGCHDNYLIDNSSNNSFASGCHDNIVKSSDGNSFGVRCYSNNLNYSNNNSFGKECSNNILDSSENNIFEDSCSNHSLGDGCAYNYFRYDCYKIVLGSYCKFNVFGYDCSSIVLGNNCYHNVFGNECFYISFRLDYSTSATPLNYCCYNRFHDHCRYMIIWNDTQPNSSNKLQNINVIGEFFGTNSSYESINITDLKALHEIKVAKNSKGETKIYCEADLIA